MTYTASNRQIWTRPGEGSTRRFAARAGSRHIPAMTDDDMLRPVAPIDLAPRFPALQQELIDLLRGLSPADWARPTSAGKWTVRDVAAHLLDTGLRRLSSQRDGFIPDPDQPISGHADLVAYLNRLNATWVAAARRLSPGVITDLLEFTGPPLARLFRELDPEAPALFSVAWAGEETSPNWFDVGREYTERWHHQQQIRDAVGAPGLTSREWLHPVLDLFLRALPFGYREVDAAPGTAIGVAIAGEAGGDWTLRRDDGWRLYTGRARAAAARIRLDQDAAWRLLTKGLPPDRAWERVSVEGDQRLAAAFLRTLAIMG